MPVVGQRAMQKPNKGPNCAFTSPRQLSTVHTPQPPHRQPTNPATSLPSTAPVVHRFRAPAARPTPAPSVHLLVASRFPRAAPGSLLVSRVLRQAIRNGNRCSAHSTPHPWRRRRRRGPAVIGSSCAACSSTASTASCRRSSRWDRSSSSTSTPGWTSPPPASPTASRTPSATPTSTGE